MFHVKVSRIPKSWKEENILAAEMIYEDCKLHNEIPVVMFSGGLDSNVVVESFRLAKVPHRIFIMRYGKGWNDYDIKYAIDWCDAYGIGYEICELNPVKFWQGSEVLKIAEESRLISPQMCLYLYAATEKVNGYPILGFGEPDLSRNNNEINAWYHSYDRSFFEYFKKRRGNALFFHTTPEQQMSWYFEKETIKFINKTKYNNIKNFNSYDNDTKSLVDGLQSHKNYYYRKFYPNLKMRVPIKNHYLYRGRSRRDGNDMTDYTGFDKLPKYVFDIEHDLRDKLIENISPYEDKICSYYKYIYKSLEPNFLDYYDKLLKEINYGF